jgi:heat shock protein HslJ
MENMKILNEMEGFMNTGIKKTMIKITLFLFTAVFSFADDVPFSRVQRIDWNLVEVKNGSTTVIIDRSAAQREIYSIRFQEGRIRGRGADNLYFAPYTAGAYNSISIGRIAGTYMAPIFEMENFREYEYFRFLEKVYRWEFHDFRLELHTRDENNAEVILEFIPIYK